MRNLIAFICFGLAGLCFAIQQEPQTHATNHIPDTRNMVIPETPVIVTPAVITPDETAPQPVAEEGEPSPLAFVAADCPGGVCSQPRATAIVRRAVTVERPRLFSRLRIRR